MITTRTLKNGNVLVEARAERRFMDADIPTYTSEQEPEFRAVAVGDEGTLYTREHTPSGNILSVGLWADGGCPGNSNPAIQHYHGWRGTFNDVGQFADGWRRVLEVRPLTRGNGWRIVFSTDLRPNEA